MPQKPGLASALGWCSILALVAGIVLWLEGSVQAQPDPARLVNIRGERTGAVAGFFLEFDRPAAVPQIHSEEGRLRFRLRDVTTSLAPARDYANFDATLRLIPEGPDLEVVIELKRFTGRPFVDALPDSAQWVVYQPLKLNPKPGVEIGGTAKLIDLDGTRYARSAAIIFTFSGPFEFSSPTIAEARTIRLNLPQITSDLKEYRRYNSFDGWLKLEPAAEGLVATMALPEGLAYFEWQRLTEPERLMIRFLPRSAETPQPVPVAAPPPVAPEPPILRLIRLTGSLEGGRAVIELTFSGPFASSPLRTDLENLFLSIPSARSDLAADHPLPDLKSSVRLQQRNNDCEIAIVKPAGFDEPLIETLNDPSRLRISFPPSEALN